jgi:gliding motility-associated-like protein
MYSKIFSFPELRIALLLFSIAFGTAKVNAQCAGTDAAIEFCNYTDPANQSIDLFALLGPDAVPGGFWVDPLQTGALNILTGELNLWNFHFTGEFTFTYVRNNIPGCIDNNAVVTVIVGGYTGVTSPDGSACDSDVQVNLFQYFIGLDPYPQQNGTWTSPNVPIDGEKYFNANAIGPGTYDFTYTTPAIGTCPEMSSTAVVTVYAAPHAGPPITEFVICEADDLSQYTNLNLADLINGEDANGIWGELGTSELSDPFDPFIDLQHVYQVGGSGIYIFTYTVFPAHPVCDKQTASIFIIIEDRIDLTGGTFTFDNFCGETSGEFIHATLAQGPDIIPDGDQYEIDYHIEGPGISETRTEVVEFINGVCHFDIASEGFGQIGSYTVVITNIRNLESHQACDNIAGLEGIINIYPLPFIDTAVLDIPTVCKGSDGLVQISAMDLPDGNYELTYSIFASNKVLDQHIIIHVENGTVQLNIPAAVIPNTGSSTFYITHIVNLKTGCETDVDNFRTFVIYDLPFVDNVTLQANNGCLSIGTTVLVTDLGTMTDINVTYDLSGANTATGQEATFNAVLGNATFTIPPSLLLNSGMTTVTLTNVRDLVTGCSSPTNVSDGFMMNILPDASLLSTTIADVCQGIPVTAMISGLGSQTDLVMNYTLSGSNNAPMQAITLTNTGNTEFTIPADLIPNTGASTFTIVNIENTITGCIAPLNTTITFNINPVPPVNTFSATIQNVCLGQQVYVLLSGFGNVTNMDITYSLSGANTATAQTASIVIAGGSAVFNIPPALLSNSGNTVFSITHAVYPDTGCNADATLTKNFTINPLPDVAALTVQGTDVCYGSAVSISISGLAGTNPVVVSYELSGANSAAIQTVTVTPSAGNAAFVIPPALIPNTGETIFTITKITNPQTACESAAAVTDSFLINVVPLAPTAANMFFCIEENAVVADLLPYGNQYRWYASADADTPLNDDIVLNTGSYFVSETSNAGCFSPRTMINVTITALQPLILDASGELFCGADDPTLQDLTANVTASDTVLWYDAAQNGNPLSLDLLLLEGATYYGVQFSETLGCTSQEVLAVTVSLTACDGNPSEYDFFIPDGFSPNGDSVNDTFRIPDIEFLYPDYSYEIYNRYGNILFKGNINKPAWDGTNTESGSEVIAPNGVYFYVIKFNKNSVSSKQGRLYLNR